MGRPAPTGPRRPWQDWSAPGWDCPRKPRGRPSPSAPRPTPDRTPPSRPCCGIRSRASRWCPTAPWATATTNCARVAGTSTWATSSRRSACWTSKAPRASRSRCPASRTRGGEGTIIRRGVPAVKVGDHLVTTVLDLMLAQYGVGRDGLPGQWAADYDDVNTPYTPAWQAEITSVPAEACIRIAREFAKNSEDSQGRTMIIIGAGICHWFHADVTYRAIMALLMLTGCIGRNGGGWAHYVG
ncbi:MAG: molybdopterin-dependent oxidoreductase, partial [Propionicimonas sp.]|nr:molybdopterin-dependent oxidoreductase [Propionicimonas sp.]